MFSLKPKTWEISIVFNMYDELSRQYSECRYVYVELPKTGSWRKIGYSVIRPTAVLYQHSVWKFVVIHCVAPDITSHTRPE